MQDLSSTFFLFVTLLGFLMAFVLVLFHREKNRATWFLAGFLFFCALFALSHYAHTAGKSVNLLACLYAIASPFFYLIGPLAYFYVRSTITDDNRLRRTDWLHFLPFFIQLVNVSAYTFGTSFSEKQRVASMILANPESIFGYWFYYFIPVRVNFIMRPLSVLLYLLICWRLLLNGLPRVRNEVPSAQYVTASKWLIYFLLVFSFLTFNYLLFNVVLVFNPDFVSPDVLSGLQTISGIAFLVMYVSVIFYPALLYGMPNLVPSKIIGPSPKPLATDPENRQETIVSLSFRLENEAITDLATKLEGYLSTGEPWLHADFTLRQLATAINVPSHHLSWYFNQHLKTSFPQFKNRQRVAYACRLLDEGKAKTHSLDAIGKMAGFSSRSTFFKAFKEVMAVSPGEYRKPESGEKQNSHRQKFS